MHAWISAVAIPLLVLLGSCDEPAATQAAPPPPEVKVATVLQRDFPVYAEAIGETRGNTEIEIRARVEGFIDSVDFKEGTPVEKGQLLYTIDPRPFETSVAQTKAALAEAEAQHARARQDVARYEPLVAKNAIAREDYDTAVAVEKSSSAAVEAARAVADRSEIDLSYTKVMAPEAGLVGKTEVYAGTLVGRGVSTMLTHISRIDPIHVRFTFVEKEYLEYARKRGSGTAEANQGMPFELLLDDGSVHPELGSIVFVDRTVDPRTGTIMAEAAFPNPDNIIRPGQYARVRVRTGVKTGAILVPQRAVLELQGVYSVMVVGDDDTVEQRMVMPAERTGSLWVIDSGLKTGERIVVEGMQKIRPGMKVVTRTVDIEEDEGTPKQGEAAEHAAATPAGDADEKE